MSEPRAWQYGSDELLAELNQEAAEAEVGGEDSHLDDYGSEWEDGFDMNSIEQGYYDDDPNVYSGDYSEE